MAKREVTGASPLELRKLEREYLQTPLHQEDDIPFEVAYCLNKIAHQPDHYDGPDRYCKRRVAKRDPEDYEGGERDEAAFAHSCPTHGGDQVKHGKEQSDKLECPYTTPIKHGASAEDKHLIMDFDDQEQKLFDSIMQDWPEIYDWPPREEDPARYRMLRRVAVNEVRSLREEEYLDGHEVHMESVYDEQGVQVGEKETENPLAREYRLLMREITSQMKELGLTPKERQKMDTLASQAEKDDAISDIAQDALNDGDGEFDPTQFEDDDGAS